MPSKYNKKGITKEQLVELYVVQRKTMVRVAYELGIYKDTLRRLLMHYEIPLRSKPVLHPNTVAYNSDIKKCASARGRHILEMLEKGMTYPQIAKREGVSRNRIYQIVRRYRPSNSPTTPAPVREEIDA